MPTQPRQLEKTTTKEPANPFLNDDPAFLLEVIDLMVWDSSMDAVGRAECRAHLLALPHADNDYIQRAIAVIDEFNAPAGSPEEAAARARAWPDNR